MFAKRPTPEPINLEQPNSQRPLPTYDRVAEPSQDLPEELSQINNDSTLDRGKVLRFPSQPYRVPPTWPDYEELLTTPDAEPTEAIAQLTSTLVNRRCYYQGYWPKNTVFRIKDVDAENNSVYLNLIYRWVSATQVLLLKNLMPQRPPTGVELNYLIDPDDCSDF